MFTQDFDKRKAEAFAEQTVSILNSGALCVMLSIGHRTRLFDTMADLPPSTSIEIAASAGLNERYVREWLAALVVGGIIEYDPNQLTYRLPAEHAAYLCRRANGDNLATFAQEVSLLGTVEDKIVDCFRTGKGLPYSEYPRFHEVMAEDSGQTLLPILLDTVLPLAEGLPERLAAGIDVLDMGCGRGRALLKLAEAFPSSRFVGYDLSEEAVLWASDQATQLGLTNIRFEQKDATAFDEPERYDLILAFDAIHDQARPDLVLAGIARALKKDGVFLMQDIAGSSHVHKNLDHPIAPLLYTISCMHCTPVSLAQGGVGLGTMWGEETAQRMLREAGFSRTDIKRLPEDIQNSYYINRVA